MIFFNTTLLVYHDNYLECVNVKIHNLSFFFFIIHYYFWNRKTIKMSYVIKSDKLRPNVSIIIIEKGFVLYMIFKEYIALKKYFVQKYI